jgi:hypothetical protein
MEDPAPTESILEDHDIRYEIVESGTKRGGKKLVSSEGFSYTVKVNSYYIIWGWGVVSV